MQPAPERARTWITGLALGPALLLLAAGLAMIHEPLIEPGCWILPNALVLPLPTDVDCSLQGDELVTAVIRNGIRIPYATSSGASWKRSPRPLAASRRSRLTSTRRIGASPGPRARYPSPGSSLPAPNSRQAVTWHPS